MLSTIYDLIMEINDGVLSRQLKKIRPGDLLKVQGPYGSFLKNALEEDQGKRVFTEIYF
ncbi:MAG: hypothetical protein R6U78_14170 [Bacteroidales bacterium]